MRVARVLEQARLEQALRRSEERYRRILGTANEGIWVLDAALRVGYVNERMAEAAEAWRPFRSWVSFLLRKAYADGRL